MYLFDLQGKFRFIWKSSSYLLEEVQQEKGRPKKKSETKNVITSIIKLWQHISNS